LEACALALLLTALKSVDFPTLGNPTIPACKAILILDLRFQIADWVFFPPHHASRFPESQYKLPAERENPSYFGAQR
jgi:hypothetical protein